MLFRCLHPMELDTGPWTKSSILCSLLLLLATFSVPQVSGQTEIVGLGKHTLENGEVMLNTNLTYNYIGVKSINSTDYNEYKDLFPDACDVTTKDGFIEIKYEGKLCTVDLLSDFNDKIELKAGVRRSREIDECLDKGYLISNGYNNNLPFIYSKNNDVIKNFSTGGPFNDTNIKCKSDSCSEIEGKCLEWTSLEVSWSKLGKSVYVHTHLIGDKGSDSKGLKKKDDEDVTTDLNIREKYKDVFCAPSNNPIVPPKAWTIKNTHLKGEYLLVFSLLSLNASEVFNGTSLTGKKPSGPKCELFIQFDTTYYRLLTAIHPPTTTTSSTTQTTATTTTEAPSTTTIFCPTPEPVTTTTCPTTTCPVTKPTEKCPEESKTFLIVMLIIGWFIVAAFLLCVGGISIWFWMKQTDKEIEIKMPEQGKDKYLRALYDAEVKKKGPVAVGTFDKWKENRMKNEKTAAKGLSSKKAGNTANKKKAVKKEQPKTKNDIVQEKYEKEWYQYLYNSEYLPELKKKGIAVVGTFDEWKKPPPAAATMIEQSPMTKTAMGTDKSVVDKGKSSTGVDGKKSATVEDIVQPFAEDPVIPDPPKKAEKVKDEEWTLEENEYDDDGNLLPKVEKGGIECPPSTESEHTLLSI